MCIPHGFILLLAAVLLLHCCSLLLLAPVSAQGSAPAGPATRWQTLSGNEPLVIAHGGFSGLFPYGSGFAYQFTYQVSLPNTVLWCDVQLTKDNLGICVSDVRLDNNTNIELVFPGRDKSYQLNGVTTSGWFAMDFTGDELANVSLMQGIYSRTQRFDNNFLIQTVEDVAGIKPAGLWLNFQYDAFYSQHNMSMRNYIVSLSRRVVINYISSPEVRLLRSIASRLNPKITKLVFQFLNPDDVEPSTNQTYKSLSQNLTFVKTFASGIIVPKDYIWPVDSDSYLLPHTSIVLDAHKAGLEVFASGFFNDVPLSYNYSFDPVTEYLYFIDNGDFSVDGVLSDFPVTASEAIGCFSHLGRNAPKQVDTLVITKNGASGDYPGCTDLAYQKAISDGADVIDCPIQVSSDGIPFCLGSINLFDSTNAVLSPFANRALKVPELESGSGLFSFSLTWSEIQQLKPVISNPNAQYYLNRNPRFKNAGKFLTLADFLALAKNSSISGVLINIENAPYLMEKQGLPVIDAVRNVLSTSGYDNQTAKRVMIQSSNSSVLMEFKEKQIYELVYKIDENIRDALPDTVKEIKDFADAVVVNKDSIFPVNSQFLTETTKIVSTLNSSKIPVYAETFSNEFVTQAWDFFSDATVEINSFVQSGNVSGIITDFPQTAARYERNRCLGSKVPTPYMAPVLPGALMTILAPEAMPPAEAPEPVLTVSDVTEPPLPPVATKPPSSSPGSGTTPGAPAPSGQVKVAACFFLSNLAMILTILLLL